MQVDSLCGGHIAGKRAVSCNYKKNRSDGIGIRHLPQTWG
jgi:hypothetical protein